MIESKLSCKICGYKATNLTSHISHKHGIRPKDYKKIYNVESLIIYSDEQLKKMSNSQKQRFTSHEQRKKQSDIQKNGASTFTEKYWINRGYSVEEARSKITDIQKRNAKKSAEKNVPENSQWRKEYWVVRRGMTESEAIQKVSEIQSKFSFKSSKFFGKTRTEESKKKISDSMKRKISEIGPAVWAGHFGEFNGYSKIEKECFLYIKENVNKNVSANVPIGHYIVDIIDGKKVVEFYGDFWHANPKFYKKEEMMKSFSINKSAGDIWKKDLIRMDYLKSIGYDVHIIWENEWRKEKSSCVEKLCKFYEKNN